MGDTCPFCNSSVEFETQAAPAGFLRKGISRAVTHVGRHEPCGDYWFAAPDGDTGREQGHLALLRALTDTEKRFYSETVRRMRDGGAWLILYLEWSRNLLACFRIAQMAAGEYGLQEVRVLHSGTGFDGQNLLLFLADDAGIHPLRVHAPDAEQDEIRSKVFWLHALAQEGIRVPRPQTSIEGKDVVWVGAQTEGRWCVLYDWIPGEMIGHMDPAKRSQAMVENIGVSMARMHYLATTIRLPAWFKRPSYGPDEVTRFVQSRAYEEDRAIVNSALSDLLSVMRDMDSTPRTFGLIHGETADGNIIIHGDTAAFIDFQRFGWGYYITDIQKLAATMSSQERAWFLASYRGVFPLPDKFDAWYEVFDRARTVLGHWT